MMSVVLLVWKKHCMTFSRELNHYLAYKAWMTGIGIDWSWWQKNGNRYQLQKISGIPICCFISSFPSHILFYVYLFISIVHFDLFSFISHFYLISLMRPFIWLFMLSLPSVCSLFPSLYAPLSLLWSFACFRLFIHCCFIYFILLLLIPSFICSYFLFSFFPSDSSVWSHLLLFFFLFVLSFLYVSLVVFSSFLLFLFVCSFLHSHDSAFSF